MNPKQCVRYGSLATLMAGFLWAGVAGCQRPARLTGVSNGDSAAVSMDKESKKDVDGSLAGAGAGEKGSGAVPNWIGDPRYVRQKGAGGTAADAGKGTSSSSGGNPTGTLTVPPSSGGSVPRLDVAVTEADMREVWIYMENASAVSGRLPPPAEVYAALVQTQAKSAELVRSGAIVLTGARTRESVWAYEARALQQGGWMAGPGGVEQVSAVELRRRLGASR